LIDFERDRAATRASGAVRATVAGFLLAIFVSAAAAQETTPPAAPAAQQTENAQQSTTAVELVDVPERREALEGTLREIGALLENGPERALTDEALGGLDESTRAAASEVEATLDSPLSLSEIQDVERAWSQRAKEFRDREKAVQARRTALAQAIVKLNAASTEWRNTLESLTAQGAPEEVVLIVKNAIDDIADMRRRTEEALARLATIEGRMTRIESRITAVEMRINQIDESFKQSILVPDSPPIWRLRERTERMADTSGQSFAQALASTAGFVGRHFVYFSMVLVFSGVIFFVTLAANRALARHRERETFEYPLLFALYVGLYAIWLSAVRVPIVIEGALTLLLLLLVAVLLPAFIGPKARPYVYALALFYAGEVVREIVAGDMFVERLVTTVGALAACAIAWWLGKPERFPVKGAWARRAGGYALRVGSVLFFVSFVADLFGFTILAQLLGAGTLRSMTVAAVATTLLLGLDRVVASVVRLPGVNKSVTIQKRGGRIRTWIFRVLVVVASIGWFLSTAEAFAFKKEVVDALAAALTAPISFGAFSFTLSNVVAAAVVILLGIGIASTLRFVLREDILARLPLDRGLPAAIAGLFYYLLLLGIFVVALAAAGIELSQLTLLTGALGVGVGFGLQNVVNNFVSGLILQFERPIHVDDVVEVNGVMGKVRRIGIRSSTVQTFEGAEVIVPNGDFVSEKVTNWTLSQQRRRASLTVGVAYGTDPNRVIEILHATALAHPVVVKDPEPVAVFKGFGDSSLDFELLFWSPDMDSFLRMKSDVAIAINAALAAEGIEIPFPQRDLNVRGASPELLAALGAPAAKPKAPAKTKEKPPVKPEPALSESSSSAAGGNAVTSDQALDVEGDASEALQEQG
jgi:small-conductance mechanosensitive channel